MDPNTADPDPAPRAAGTAAPGRARTATAASPRASFGRALPRWLLPIAAAVALGLFVWAFLDDRTVKGAGEETAVAGTAAKSESPAAGGESAPSAEASVEHVHDQLAGVFAATTETLRGVADEAGARAALPALKDANTKLGDLKEQIQQMPDSARTKVGSAVERDLGTLRPLADEILETPGVGPVVEPVLKPMLEKMASLAG